MSLQSALSFTLPAEGGFSDNLNDPGGATMKGITQSTYDRFRNSKGLPPSQVKDISDADVEAIYQQMYWIPSHCGELSARLGVVVFDTAVNTGVQRAIKLLQDALGVESDGIFGVGTRTALEEIPDSEVCEATIDARRSFYRALASEKPKLAEFMNGWLKRCDNLQQYILTL